MKNGDYLTFECYEINEEIRIRISHKGFSDIEMLGLLTLKKDEIYKKIGQLLIEMSKINDNN